MFYLFVLSSALPAFAVFTEQGATMLNGTFYDARSASLADIDNDGDLDLYFQGASTSRQVWLNNIIGTGARTFTNVTSTWLAGITTTDSWSAAWGDYNSDGKIDVFIGQTNSGSLTGRLLRNTGTAFVDDSVATGLNDPGFAQNVGWVDINNDHKLDLLIGMEGPAEKNEIYLQGPAGHFTAVGAAAGFQQAYGNKAYGMAMGDTDGDGDLDVYISTCIGGANIRNNFYKNMLVETGALSFVDIADTNGTQYMDNSYGTEFLDFDNDGRLDLFMTGADGYASKIWRNNGNNQFTDVDTITGHPLLSNTGGDLNGSRAIDYDNDGDLDLFFHDHLPAAVPNGGRKLYRNDGNWTFTDVTSSEIFDTSTNSKGAYDSAWGDIDRDGDLDLIAPTDGNWRERVFVNDASTNGNHWLYVKLKGPDWNTTGIGSTLYATLNDGTPQKVTLRREANTNANTFNQSDLPVHFGLGSALLVNRLMIHWPDGTRQTLNTILGDQYITVTYNPGDYNSDNAVDAGDYLVWRKGLGTDYRMDDYLVWRNHFGTKLVGSGALEGDAVPEGATLVLFLAAIPTIFCRPSR